MNLRLLQEFLVRLFNFNLSLLIHLVHIHNNVNSVIK